MQVLFSTYCLFFLATLWSCQANLPASKPDHQPTSVSQAVAKPESTQENPCFAANDLNTRIRDGKITKAEAQAEIKRLFPLIASYYQENGGKPATGKWTFPLKGYTASAIGGTNGSGYIAQGYDYFQGNKHGGHPAHDLFIRDKDQDGLDDKSGSPVEVLSVTNGIVVAAEPEWEAESTLRGGKYLWILSPDTKRLCYYAHNAQLLVNVGDIVQQGQAIAYVGRTGLNAYKQRSPTHLHFSMLEIGENGNVQSQNPYTQLVEASVVK